MLRRVAAIAILLPVLRGADSLSQEERQFAIQSLEDSRKQFVDAAAHPLVGG